MLILVLLGIASAVSAGLAVVLLMFCRVAFSEPESPERPHERCPHCLTGRLEWSLLTASGDHLPRIM